LILLQVALNEEVAGFRGDAAVKLITAKDIKAHEGKSAGVKTFVNLNFLGG
jgi:hypothetical protein